MGRTIEYTSMNQSPTMVVKVKSDLGDVRGKAVKFDGEEVTYPVAGEMPVGFALLSESDEVKAKDEITVQIKDIGMWMAGAAVVTGDFLATDTEGLCQKATQGQYIFARALSGASAKGDYVTVQIIHAGYAV